jgi:pimeloyl-ACP methyl ester carboxylesterase
MGLHVISRAPLAEGPGNGHVLVAVHGAMDRSTSFRRLWTHLPDWAVVAYDRRGYAGSLDLPVTQDFGQQVHDLLEVVHAEVRASDRVVALGHSYGGNVVLAAAAANPDLLAAAVVYEPPALWLRPWPNPVQPELTPGDQAEAFIRRVAGDRVWERLPEATRQLRRAEGDTLASDMASLRSGMPFDPKDVTIPVVVGYGGRGYSVAAEWARRLAADLPDSRLVEVPGAEHGIHVGDPDALASLVRTAARMAA